jgi:translation initiation factor IF-2
MQKRQTRPPQSRKRQPVRQHNPAIPVVTENEEPKERKAVEIPAVLSVKEFAEYLKLPVTKIIATLMKNGVIANINETIDVETAMIIGDELGFDISEKIEEKTQVSKEETIEDESQRIPRPPVVTVMGHVDHGKTTLLDAIRKTNVVASESGGITQHIGAYQVNIKNKETKEERFITFLDTPGHEAFSAMRAHGASITDIVILVVAADDGVKPQTVEAINHSHAAGVPIIVAINKIDLPGANPDRVKQELAERDLIPEEWGGKTIMVPISAKKGDKIDELLDMVLLVADLKTLSTNPKKPANGVVIESRMQAGVGPRATILVNDGTLNQGDVVVAGNTYGKIRFMEDFRGKRIKSAGASTPVRIAGLNDVPNFGEPLIAADSEKEARQLTQVKSAVRQHISKAEISEALSDEKNINIILKTDVQGSLEAIRTSLGQINTPGVNIKIINEAVGEINESDVNMAETTNAFVLGFRTTIKPAVKQLAERKKVRISIYEIIYQLLDDLYASMAGLVEPEKVEVNIGKAIIVKVFHSTKSDYIIGVRATDGKLTKKSLVKIIRDEEQVGEAEITSLKRNQEEVDTIQAGIECGVGLKTQSKIQEGDKLEIYQIEEKIRTQE